MRIAPWIVAVIGLFALWRLFPEREITHPPGMLAAREPVQRPLWSAPGIDRDGFRLVPRAEFAATVRILRREDYSLGELARLVPTDFAVGWGPMSDSAVLSDIEISQGNRFYYWRTRTWPVERRVIETHSANWHVISGDAAVRRVLDEVRAGTLVELRGRLVDVEGGEAGLRTSLSRDDTGAGACEILLASEARVVTP